MHEVDYKVFGEDIQFVEIELDPGEAAVAEAGWRAESLRPLLESAAAGVRRDRSWAVWVASSRVTGRRAFPK
jgi:hypothetical protein